MTDQERVHDLVRRFLADPSSYAPLAHSAQAPIEEITTHGARVFLAGDRAFKIKRPIAFAYMDFSTEARRRRAIGDELLLNRRLAPDLYLAVHPIYASPEGLPTFENCGPIIDWALEMRRFPTENVLDHVEARGDLTTAQIISAAEALADFHETGAEVSRTGGGASGIAQVIDVAERELQASVPEIFSPAEVADFISRMRQSLDRLTPLLDQRRADGYVRMCHGDLHLGNLVALGSRVVPFDCIEFNDEFARIDVMYDLAFLLMDLCRRGRSDFANAALNAYLSAVKPAALKDHLRVLAAMPLFLAARAGVRAHVLGRQGQADQARAFLVQGRTHLDPAPAPIIALGGLQGSGKSTLARALAPRLGALPGAVILRSDALRKAMLGVRPTERLDQKYYDRETGARAYDLLLETAQLAHAANWPVILDAVFYRPDERARAEQLGPDMRGFWLEADPRVVRARLAARTGDVSDAGIDVYEAQRALDPGPMTWTRLDTSGDPAEVGRRISL